MVLGVSTCQYREVPRSISFSGSGFLATYQLGSAQCFRIQAPWILQTAPSVLGASAGSLVAAAVVCQMDPTVIRDEMLAFAREMKKFTLGPLNPSINIFHWLEKVLFKHLPNDAHRMASGRLVVGLTRLTDGKHVSVSEYQSKHEVIQVLLCSCYVPGYCGMLPPSFRGQYYVDGGFTRMQPVLQLPCSQTLTVSPFSGDVDICPDDSPAMLKMVVAQTTLKGNVANTVRIFNALYPLDVECLEDAYHKGYNDTVQFLVNHELIAHPMMTNISQEPMYTRAPMFLDTMVEDVQEKTVDTKKVSFETGEETEAFYKSNKQASIAVELLNSVLLVNLVAYMSMFGVPAILLSYLLIPVVLPLLVLPLSRPWLESELMHWTLHGMKHFFFFFLNTCIFTFKRNFRDMLGPIPLLVKLLWFEREMEKVSQELRTTSTCKLPASSIPADLRCKSLPPQRGNKNPGFRIL